jgi:hypothetical protein
VKKFIFCLIAVTATATLLLPSGQAFAKSKWVQYPIGNTTTDFNASWDVETYDPDCYNYTVVNGTLTVFADSDCAYERFFAKITGLRQATAIKADVTIRESYWSWRVRLLADPLYVPDIAEMPGRLGTVFHQLSLLNNSIWPHTMIARLLGYPSDPYLSVFDATFMRPWPAPLLDHTYTLTLFVDLDNDTINSKIVDTEQNYGEIVFEVPGLTTVDDNNFIGLSCYSPGSGDSGIAEYRNVWVRY